MLAGTSAKHRNRHARYCLLVVAILATIQSSSIAAAQDLHKPELLKVRHSKRYIDRLDLRIIRVTYATCHGIGHGAHNIVYCTTVKPRCAQYVRNLQDK